jgi:murein peptide amidase A
LQQKIARWRAVAKTAGMSLRVLTELAGEKIIYLESRARESTAPLIYLSAGVHGDEAGSVWGLLHWAETQVELLRHGRYLIFPCLNPHGLRSNTRADQRGLDINRRFHLDQDPLCGPWRQVLREKRAVLGLCLHEDYDAQGCYVYELSQRRTALSPSLLAACTRRIPADSRPKIDGRRARQGIIRRSTIPQDLPGLPEAIVLWQLGCPLTLTFETPSEFSLQDRVQTQADFVSAAVHHIRHEAAHAS